MPSSLIRRGVWAIGAAVIVIALVVAALPLIASTRIVRDRIAWEMSAWSGFRVAIDGSPRIEVWPKFRAILTDVTLSKWTDADAPPVVEAERVEIDLSAMAALQGDVAFSTARLVRPTIRVQRTADGLFLPTAPTGAALHAPSTRRAAWSPPTPPSPISTSCRPMPSARWSSGTAAWWPPSTARTSRS